MSRDLNATHSAAYAGENVRSLTLVYLDFSSGIERIHDGVGDYTFDSQTWSGVGDLGNISVLEEGVELRPLRIKLTLSGIKASLVTTAMTEEYHGRTVRVYRATLDADQQFNADPDLIWSGQMDYMTVSLGKETGTIELVCENLWSRFAVPKTQRMSDADQRARFAGDRFFEYVPQLDEQQLEWGGEIVRSGNITSSGGSSGSTGGNTGAGPWTQPER